MQTFLPLKNIEKSIRILDSKRLGKQRVEAFQILNIVLKRTHKTGWKNHPAVKMWRKNPNALKFCFNCCLKEWIKRDYKNNMKFEKIRGKIVFPSWVGNKKFHASHRSNLLRKNKKYYSKFRWKEDSNLPYFWPGVSVRYAPTRTRTWMPRTARISNPVQYPYAIGALF